MTTDPFQPLVQLGILAAALLLAGFATMLQRRPEPTPDWPPSPPPAPHVRRDLVVVSASLGFLVTGVGIAVLALAVSVYTAVALHG